MASRIARWLCPSLLAVAFFCPGAARAQEESTAQPEAAEAIEEPADAEWAFDVSFGAALTTDYMFRGITQTDHQPAIQPYIEPSFGIFYGGVWASNVDYNAPEPDVEIDLYMGLRPTFGPVEADLGFLHYVYPGASESNYSEVKAALSVSPTEMLTVGAEADYSWDYAQSGDEATYIEASAALELPRDFSVSAALGYQMYGTDTGLSDYVTWNIGASYAWRAATFDLRYHDTDLGRGDCSAEYTRANSCDARIVASVSVDTSWSALKGGE